MGTASGLALSLAVAAVAHVSALVPNETLADELARARAELDPVRRAHLEVDVFYRARDFPGAVRSGDSPIHPTC